MTRRPSFVTATRSNRLIEQEPIPLDLLLGEAACAGFSRRYTAIAYARTRVTALRFLCVVVAAGVGAVAVIATFWLLFMQAPGLNDRWVFRYAGGLVVGAAVVGAIVAGVLTYVGAQPETVARAPRRLALLTALGTFLVLFYLALRGFSAQG
jgi:hypothetical protein